MNRTASTSWPHKETDPQRIDILAAADRLLAGSPKQSSGNLSIVQLAREANVKYWVVAQKTHRPAGPLPRLAVPARKAAAAFHDKHNPLAVLQRDHAGLKAHCEGLELLLQTYATVINELTLQNEALRAQTGSTTTTVTPFPRRHPGRPTL